MRRRIRDTWNRFLTWLRALWSRLLGRTPPIEQQRGAAGSGLIAYQSNHS